MSPACWVPLSLAVSMMWLAGCGPSVHQASYPPLTVVVARPPTAKKKVVVAQKIEIKDWIEFKRGSATLRASSREALDHVLELLRKNPGIRLVEIQGHTDEQGSPTRNQKLSLRRAAAVKAYLVVEGIEPERLAVKGFGAERPLVEGRSENARRQNRRVEFIILEQQTSLVVAERR